MNPKRFLQHFNEISEAPDAVPRLRRFILDLAVRGKLVPQEPNDEPAREVLKRIEMEKLRLAKEGNLPRPRRMPQQNKEDLPYESPNNWEWCRLDEISLRIHYGYTASAKPNIQDIRLLRITDIQNNNVQWESVPGCEISDEQEGQYLLADGDILIARTGGTIGKSFLVKGIPVKAVFASYLIRVQGSREVFDHYLKLFLESPVYWKQLEDGSRGAGQPNVNGQTLGNMEVALPPLPEQHRIVAKVDELMALCDELEEAQQKRERRRDRLVAATLNGLGRGELGRDRSPNGAQGKDGSPSRPNVLNNGGFGETALPQFFLTHLPRLTTRPEHIQQLRQTILNLAVGGKLVPQDPNDEPAEKLLSAILDKKQKLAKSGDIKKDKKLWEGIPDSPPNAIPSGWVWTRMQDVFEISRGGSPRPAGDTRYFGGEIPWITVREITKDTSRFLTGTEGGLTAGGAEKSRFIDVGDLLLTNSGATLGVPKISRIRGCINDGVAVLRLFHQFNLNDFAYEYLRSQTDLFRSLNQGMGQPNLNTPIIAAWHFPLPPLAEQHRIVAKVDELMGLCDGLESRLNSSATTRRQLLEATLNEALARC